ncbi:DciA family protein [Streptomyces sp. NBC_00105]|uniref:DciA family protein n=1 Tax=Streptomyces sp. NBC_00105 TaxID=2903622 RepID=UPI00324B77A0
MSGSEVSRVDLARVALRAAMEAARRNDSGQKAKSKPRVVRTVRREGREPMGLGAALGALVTERAWTLPATGASLCEWWAAIAPDLAGHVTAVGFDPESGRLTVCPESSAWATKARLEQSRVIAAANAAAGGTVVRALRILPPGAAPAPGWADAAAGPVTPTAALVQRRTPPEGYRRAIEAHRAAAPPRQADSGIAEAVKRQSAAMRELSRRAFPEPEAVADDVSALIEAARAQRRRQAAATEAAALHRACAERAQRSGAAVMLPQPAPVGTTA